MISGPSQQADLHPITDQLEMALRAGQLPKQYQAFGESLLSRLRKPVQVVVIGPPGSGKSALLDMLLGRVVIGKTPATGLIEITHGPQEWAEIHLPNRDVTQFEGLLATHAAVSRTKENQARTSETQVPRALRLRQELPDNRLRGVNLTEITLAGRPENQAAILEQALAFGDITLWCSPEFSPQEQALWSTAPDLKKDHAFLVLTMADRQIMRGQLSQRLETLEERAGEDFLGIYPLAAVQGLTAQTGQTDQTGRAGIDRKLWRASGGKRLYDDLMHQIDMGRTCDLDQADMLVRQFSREISRSPATPFTRFEPLSTKQASSQATKHAARRSPKTAPQVAAKAPQDALAAAAELLTAKAQDLLQQSTQAGPNGGRPANAVETVLDGALDAVRSLSEQLATCDETTPEIRAAQTAALDGEEVLMLCQIEQNEEAAIDAVTLLLQLKREMAPSDASPSEIRR